MKATILERRATLFVGAPIKVTSDNIPIFITTFSQMGLLPSVNRGVGIKVTPKGIEQEDVISLDMKYLDETVKVSIGPDRIDIVSKKVDENWDTFREFVLKIAKEIRTTFNKDIIRYAQCASRSPSWRILVFIPLHQSIPAAISVLSPGTAPFRLLAPCRRPSPTPGEWRYGAAPR